MPGNQAHSHTTPGPLYGLAFYVPRGTDQTVHRPERLQQVAAELNDRPGKCLDWATAAEIFTNLKNEPSGATTG